MTVPPVGAVGFSPMVAPRVDVASATQDTAARSGGVDFGHLVLDGIDRLEQVQQKSDSLAVKAATGDLQSIHDYTIAATQAAVTTQVTVAMRNKAVEAFNEIMRMQV